MNTSTYDYDNIVSTNILFTDNIDRWKFLYRSYVGGKEYRDAGYLTRYAMETQGEYQARCNETPLDNHVQSVVQVYNSFLFREQPEREFGLLEMTPELEDFLKDTDFEGRSFDAFMREVNTWANVFGHTWVIMCKPNIGATNRAEEIAQGIRPYLNILTPLVVIDWSWSRTLCGRYELDYFKYIEDVNGNIQTIREWSREEIITYIVDNEHQEVVNYIVEPNMLGMIPAVISYGNRGITRGIGNSNVGDIADMQRYIFNCYSESAQSVRLDSHPSLVVTPDTQVGTGAGSIIQIPENMDAGLKPYVLDFAGASIESILKLVDNAVKGIEKMANLGGVRATQSSGMSGVALETEFQLLNARLATMADNMELTEEQIWNLYCLYQQVPERVKIEYPATFSMRDKMKEIQELQGAKSAATDPRVLALIDHEVIEFLGEDADLIMPEMTTLVTGEEVPFDSAEPFEDPEEMFNPETGETGWVIDFTSKRELMQAGWIEKD